MLSPWAGIHSSKKSSFHRHCSCTYYENLDLDFPCSFFSVDVFFCLVPCGRLSWLLDVSCFSECVIIRCFFFVCRIVSCDSCRIPVFRSSTLPLNLAACEILCQQYKLCRTTLRYIRRVLWFCCGSSTLFRINRIRLVYNVPFSRKLGKNILT